MHWAFLVVCLLVLPWYCNSQLIIVIAHMQTLPKRRSTPSSVLRWTRRMLTNVGRISIRITQIPLPRRRRLWLGRRFACCVFCVWQECVFFVWQYAVMLVATLPTCYSSGYACCQQYNSRPSSMRLCGHVGDLDAHCSWFLAAGITAPHQT